MTESTPGKQVMHLRIPADLHRAVTEFASRTHRSVNGAAVHLMEQGLESEAAGSVFSPDPVHTR